eukprot:TRINITY_DN5938_c0_g4_i1.p1 TRINITY_DN5938_c0_g4~~TRINITY_DN5938_c0_g4_i1.p1  ORF type:complete len:542 (+),score=105.76 TRINITY_DN5938_c0_g4_i1:162-1787(+)
MMNPKGFSLASSLIPETYLKQAQEAGNQRQNLLNILLSQRRIPQEGWDESSIELLLHELSLMDSNNFRENVGVGEREARIFSDIVKKRHFRFGHGIGRSGDLDEVQPKAAGSSLIAKITNYMVNDAIKIAGITSIEKSLVVPMATGMTLTLTLLTLKQQCHPDAKYVIWPRIDQKSCLKCIITAGLTPVVVENILQGDELTTNIDQIQKEIINRGPESIVCVLSTTSCFAPRIPDNVIEISALCKKYNIGHIINNAYGLQSTKTTHNINEACRIGGVNAIVQSSDKNFMVPVGGSIITSHNRKFIDDVSKNYPGRASGSPTLDLFITLLSMGRTGYQTILTERKNLFSYLKESLETLAHKFGERVLVTPHNPISIAMTLNVSNFPNPTFLGSMLFSRGISGVRVVDPRISEPIKNNNTNIGEEMGELKIKEEDRQTVKQLPEKQQEKQKGKQKEKHSSSNSGKKVVGGIEFSSYGSHYNGYPTPYLTAACAIGMTKKEVDKFILRLAETIKQYLDMHKIDTNTSTTTSDFSDALSKEKRMS